MTAANVAATVEEIAGLNEGGLPAGPAVVVVNEPGVPKQSAKGVVSSVNIPHGDETRAAVRAPTVRRVAASSGTRASRTHARGLIASVYREMLISPPRRGPAASDSARPPAGTASRATVLWWTKHRRNGRSDEAVSGDHQARMELGSGLVAARAGQRRTAKLTLSVHHFDRFDRRRDNLACPDRKEPLFSYPDHLLTIQVDPRALGKPSSPLTSNS